MSNDTALATIQNARKNGSLVFVEENFMPQTELYRPEVTTITLKKEDCHNISGKFMPRREFIDRIGEAAGIVFNDVRGHTETIDDPATGRSLVFVGNAQGKVRTSDGSWRTSSLQEYDWDPTLRAMLDCNVTELTSATRKQRKKDKWGKEGKSTDELIMEYKKHGKQRAQTGARLRVIRELTGMPAAFTAEEISKPLVFARIVQNTDYILKTPQGKNLATMQALGMDVAALWGKANGPPEAEEREVRDVTPPSDDVPAEDGAASLADAAASEEPEFPDDPVSAKAESGFDKLTGALTDFAEGHRDTLNVKTGDGRNPYEMAVAELDDPNATVESRESMIRRLRTWLKKKGVDV